MSIRIGDTSRRRRFADPARQAWYAFHRAWRFARRMLGETVLRPVGSAELQQDPAGQIQLKACPILPSV